MSKKKIIHLKNVNHEKKSVIVSSQLISIKDNDKCVGIYYIISFTFSQFTKAVKINKKTPIFILY